MPRVAVINDYAVIIAGVHAFLAPHSDRIRLVERASLDSGPNPVDVALFDSFASPLGRGTHLESLVQDPTIGSVAVYSGTSDPAAIRDAFDAGAHGFLSKSLTADELVSGIEEIAAGRRVTLHGTPTPTTGPDRWPAAEAGLSMRESQVIGLIVRGLSNEEIAAWCYLSPNTVKTYVRSAYRKMGVTTRAQAVAWGIENGLSPDR